MKVVDAGHKYDLLSLDGEHSQRLQFVKRCDPLDPSKFPGNTDAYPGTTVQSVVRALLDRLRYLQRQVWALENVFVIAALRSVLWLMEVRAARRHGRIYLHGVAFAERAALCVKCGHTQCEHEKGNYGK